MTLVTRLAKLSVSTFGFFFWISAYSGTAIAYAPQTYTPSLVLAAVLAPKVQSAEICISNSGQVQIIRGFGIDETYFVVSAKTPSENPDVKEGYRFNRVAGGFTQKNVISFDMFELMVEPFGGAPVVRTQWLKTFEEIFEGRITVTDGKGMKVGTFDMTCNAAIVEF